MPGLTRDDSNVHYLFVNMTSRITASADTAQTDPAGAREESCARCAPADPSMATLDELSEIGMTIARALKEEALARAAMAQAAAVRTAAALAAGEPLPSQPPAGGIDLSLSFSRVSRAVRLTLALKAKLASDRLDLIGKQHAHAIGAARRNRRKRQVTEAIEKLIEAEALEAGRECDRESLYADLSERLDDAEMEDKLGQGRVGDILTRICRDLGVTPRWELWRGTSWYLEEGWSPPQAEEPEDEDEDEEEPDEDDEAEIRAEKLRRDLASIRDFFGLPPLKPDEIDDS